MLKRLEPKSKDIWRFPIGSALWSIERSRKKTASACFRSGGWAEDLGFRV